MPYGNYSYVIDSSFTPFSMQEMLVPFAMYKDEFEKSEEAYNELTNKSDEFKYLSETLPEGSKARELYEGYANDLRTQAEDFAQNGLNMGNRRALTNLKRRYQGEIGRLAKADETLQTLLKDRRSKGSSWLWDNENLTLDDVLANPNINPYGIDSNELYTRGAAAGKAASSRIYSAGDEGSTLNGYYRKWVERNGYSKESMDAFRANAAAIPELQQAADAILAERGVTENLTGNNLERARQSVLNGIIDGAVYQERINPVRDEGVMSASARAQYDLQREQMTKSAAQSGLIWDAQTNSWKYILENDPAYQRQNALAEKKAELEKLEGNNGTKKPATTHDGLLEKPLRISFNSSMPERTEDGTWQDVDAGASFEEDYTSDIIEPEDVGSGKHYTYSQLPSFVKRKIPANLDHNKHLYIINEDNDTGGWGLLTPNSYTVTIVPVKTTISNATGDTPAASSAITDTNFGFN